MNIDYRGTSLQATLNWVHQNYPQEIVKIVYRDPQTHDEEEREGPKYLYRGEADLYKASQSGLHRIFHISKILAPSHMAEYDNYVMMLCQWLEVTFGQVPVVNNPKQVFHGSMDLVLEISGLIQHYGFAASMLDFTSSRTILGHFASDNRGVGSERGRIYVAETQKLVQNTQVIDLSRSHGYRPSKQEAFVLLAPNVFDFQTIANNVGHVAEFHDSAKNTQAFIRDPVYDAKNDVVASEIVRFHSKYQFANPGGAVEDYTSRVIWTLVHQGAR